MPWARYLPLSVLFVVAMTLTAAAQPPRSMTVEPAHCTSLGVFGGVSTADSDVGALIGGSGGWQVTPWFGIEGNAMWLDQPGAETGFSASANAHFSLLTHRKAAPFVTGGFGLYHASFAAGAGAAPKFYSDRFKTTTDVTRNQRFTDPAFIVGAGVNMFVSENVALRPEVETMFVVHDGESHVVPVFTVHLVYHFADHPVTPSRR
jgi:hypothetical protein